MATKKKALVKKVVKKATPKKKATKRDSLDFELILLGKGSKDSFDVKLDIKGNALSLGVALGQLMTEDKKLEGVFKVAIDYYMKVMNKKANPISRVQKAKSKKK